MTGAIRQDLEFDVARILDDLFNIDLVVSKSSPGLHLGDGKFLFQGGAVCTDPDTPAAAAAGRLDHDRVTDVLTHDPWPLPGCPHRSRCWELLAHPPSS